MTFFINAIKNLIHRMIQLFSFGSNRLSNSLNIYIKTNTGSTLSVDLDPNWDIKNVKEIVAPQLGLEPEEVKIIFAGKELGDEITIAECDLGQQSILHAVKAKVKRNKLSQPQTSSLIEENDEQIGGKPLCETLTDTMFSNDESTEDSIEESDNTNRKVHFYVFCPTCKSMKSGKIRVRCNFCKSGAFTVHSDPQNWNDVLEPKQITGLCENDPKICADILNNAEPTFAEFYFKCSEHTSLGETDEAVPLYLIRPNLREISCLACGDTSNPVFVFPCTEGHVSCLDCFRTYCVSRLSERQFWQHPEFGYTLACPAGCSDSFIKEIHHFRLLTENQYAQYQRFATEEYVLRSGGVLCPQPGCGMGIIVDPDCNKITCLNGCGYVFCRLCLQGYHIGECEDPDITGNENTANCSYNIDPARAVSSRWDEASKVAIKVLTKPCPKCRTPTERDGGCMHMICTRSGCKFHWCWVCQTEWTRDCMGSHWFDPQEIAIRNAAILQQKIPRPPNAFMLYANENRKAVAQMFPSESNKEISKRLGINWKMLEIQQKAKYFDRAKVIDLEHKKKYPNYVYNPKEARIRKAMREATRDRSIGASPMLPRPSARRPSSHGWVGGHDESLMMPPLAGMRGGLESPVCFPISTGTGSTQFMPPMNGYSKLDSPISSNSNVLHHTNYMQPNPLAQLQQQTEMWHNYQESIRPRSSGNPFMIQDVPQGYPPPQAHDVSNSMLMEKQQQQQARQTHSVNSSISMTPPHSNENVPPDGMIDRVGTPAHVDSNSNGDCENNEVFESKHVIETVQPLMENNNMQSTNTTYMTMYGQNVTPQHQFGKMEDKMKKTPPESGSNSSSSPVSSMYLPLSSTNFCASPELFYNDSQYQKEYLAKYFQNINNYDVINVVGEDGIIFPYVTVNVKPEKNGDVFNDVISQPNYVQTDVGYIPVFESGSSLENVLDLTNVGVNKCNEPMKMS